MARCGREELGQTKRPWKENRVPGEFVECGLEGGRDVPGWKGVRMISLWEVGCQDLDSSSLTEKGDSGDQIPCRRLAWVVSLPGQPLATGANCLNFLTSSVLNFKMRTVSAMLSFCV